MTEGAAEFARFLRFWADTDLEGYPVYQAIARPLAEDEELLERVAHVAPRQKIVPVLLFAAVKWLVDREPGSPLGRIYASGAGDPWPPFRVVLQERFDEIAELLLTRRTQTNEVSRASATLLALALVERRVERPLALIELGPSAGLNLLLDRFFYDYGSGRTAGDPGSDVRLVCETRGPFVPPIPARPPVIASRCGIDLDPVDVSDEVQTRWLEACVWPGAPARAERLRAAVALARRDPPLLHRGSALELLPAVLDAVPSELVPCVVCTWMLAYLADDERATLVRIIDRFAARRDVACVTAEYAGVSPWAPQSSRTAAGADGRLATLLAMSVWQRGTREARALAWMHSHGAWIDWLDRESALGLSLEASAAG